MEINFVPSICLGQIRELVLHAVRDIFDFVLERLAFVDDVNDRFRRCDDARLIS